MKSLINKTHETDKGSLCDSMHTIEVGVTENENGIIVPMQSYILVSLDARDTSGGGIYESWFSTIVSAPLKSVQWAGTSLADYSREKGVVYGEGFVGGFAKGYKTTIDSTGSFIKKGAKKLKFWAESPMDYTPYNNPLIFNATTDEDWGNKDWTSLDSWMKNDGEAVTWSDMFGTSFHPADASRHKIRFQAWCSYKGNKRKMYDSEISGCRPTVVSGECIDCCELTSFEEFLISSPGDWEVKVTSVATGSCASLGYEETATFTVPEPEGWTPVPLVASLTSFSNSISEAVGFQVSPAYIAIAGSILVGGIAFKMIRK